MSASAELPAGFPWAPFAAAGAVLAILAYGVFGPALPRPLPPPPTAVSAARSLVFRTDAAGGIAISDARHGDVIETVAPGQQGFLRGVMHGVTVRRAQRDVAADAAFRLERGAAGRLVLVDPTDGELIDLEAFGPTNAALFARLLTLGRPQDNRAQGIR